MKEFTKDKLKHVDTVEKNKLPSAGGNLKSKLSVQCLQQLYKKIFIPILLTAETVIYLRIVIKLPSIHV